MHTTITAIRHLTDDPSLFWLAIVRGVSSVGDWLYLAALPILVYQATGDVALVGVISAVRLVPWLVLSIPAGIVVDRIQARTVLLATESMRAALMLLMGLLAAIDAPFETILLAAVAAAGCGTFAMPAFSRIVPEIARDAEQLGRANVVGSGLDNLACIIGPAIAALLIVSGGLEVAFVLNGVSFLGVVAVLHRIASPNDAANARSTGADAAQSRSALGWSRQIRAVARPLVLDAAVSFAAGFLMVLPVLAIASDVGGGDAFAGVLSMAAGVGGVAGACGAASFVNKRPGRGMTAALATMLVGLLVVALGTVPAALTIGIVLSAAAVVALDTLNLTQVQRTLDAQVLGRVFGLINTSAALWVILGSLVPTLLAEALGLGTVVLGSTFVIAVLGGSALLPMPRLAWPRSVPATSPSTSVG